jgi:hypothetical protein
MDCQFLAVTGTEDAADAEAMLEGNGWNVEGTIDLFFAHGFFAHGFFAHGADDEGGL